MQASEAVVVAQVLAATRTVGTLVSMTAASTASITALGYVLRYPCILTHGGCAWRAAALSEASLEEETESSWTRPLCGKQPCGRRLVDSHSEGQAL
jgi:hypothetical protein